MRNPEQARGALRVVWRRHAGEWLGGVGDWPLNVTLRAPGEKQAAQDWTAFDCWRSQWHAWQGNGEVQWGERRWPLLGRQAVPERWSLREAAEAAEALGELPRWQSAERRFRVLVERWPKLESNLRKQFDLLADIDENEFIRMFDMLVWLQTHPASNLFARQLPVAGMDSKWLETRTALLGDWLRILAGLPRATDFWQASGLRREPDRLRLRVLDPVLRSRLGGLSDILAPLDDLAALDLPARHVFIVENKQTGLAFEDLPKAAVLMGRGYAVDRLAQLPWLSGADEVHYWGDIDTHGLAILGRLRGHLPQTQSILMDEVTLLAHRSLWVIEPQPHRAETIEHLNDEEESLYRDLCTGRWGACVRLEQERIAWNVAWDVIRNVTDA